MRTSILTAPAAAAALCIGLAACSGPVPQPTPTAEPSYAVTGDGVLRIGTLFPSSGADAAYSTAQVAGVEAAIREINEAGGFAGVPVEVLHRNAGDSEGSLAQAGFDSLVARGVDVVIGPPSPGVVEMLAPAAALAGVALYSTAPTPSGVTEAGPRPTATTTATPTVTPAPAATLPTATRSDQVVRVTPDDAAQAGPILAAIAAGGGDTVGVLHSRGDTAGNALLARLRALADAEGVVVSYNGVLGTSENSRTKTIAALQTSGVDAVIVATSADDPESTGELLSDLTSSGVKGDALWLAHSVLADYSALLPDTVLTGAHAVILGSRSDPEFIARLRQADPSIGNTTFAAEAYDATIIAVLAATLVGDDGGPALARTAALVTGGGIPCSSLGACLSVLATEPAIDYTGVSGPLVISAAGDAAEVNATLVEYGDSNTFAPVETGPAS